MAKGQVRKRCVDCKRAGAASANTLHCDRCGGELVTIVHRARRKVRRD